MISDTLNIDGVIYDVPDDKKREVERVNAEFQKSLWSMKLSDTPRTLDESTLPGFDGIALSPIEFRKPESELLTED